MKKRPSLVLAIFILVLIPFSLAQIDCLNDQNCLDLYGEGFTCIENQCFPEETTLNQTNQNQNLTTTQTTTQTTNETTNQSEITQALSKKVDTLTQQTQQLNAQVITINQQVQANQQNIQSLTTGQQNLQAQQQSIQNTITQTTQKVNTVSTGLAASQTDIQLTQEEINALEEQVSTIEESRTVSKKLILFIVFLVVFTGITAYIVYYKKNLLKIPFALKKHIHSHLKQGRPYTHIRKDLLGAGWSEEHVDTAYKQVLTHNYQKYSQRRKPSASPQDMDQKKILTIAVISIVVIAGLIILVQQGILAGKAIYMVDDLSLEEFNFLAKQTLENGFTNNDFYQSLPPVELCVQIPKNDQQSLSYRLVKTPNAHAIKETKTPCDVAYNKYDFTFKFTSWPAFYGLSKDITCQGLKTTHQTKGMYVLPSKYVLPGFTPDLELDYSSFCTLLTKCLSKGELALLDIGC